MKEQKSTTWALRAVGTVGFNVPTGLNSLKKLIKWRNLLQPGLAVRGALFQLKNLTTGDERFVLFGGACVAAGFGRATVNIEPDWVHFETVQPVGFRDFAGPARLGNLSIGIGFGGVSPLSFIVFDGIDVNQAWYRGDEIGLNTFDAGTAFDVGWCPLGVVTAVSDAGAASLIEQEQNAMDTSAMEPGDPRDDLEQPQCVETPVSVSQSIALDASSSAPDAQPTPAETCAQTPTSSFQSPVHNQASRPAREGDEGAPAAASLWGDGTSAAADPGNAHATQSLFGERVCQPLETPSDAHHQLQPELDGLPKPEPDGTLGVDPMCASGHPGGG